MLKRCNGASSVCGDRQEYQVATLIHITDPCFGTHWCVTVPYMRATRGMVEECQRGFRDIGLSCVLSSSEWLSQVRARQAASGRRRREGAGSVVHSHACRGQAGRKEGRGRARASSWSAQQVHSGRRREGAGSVVHSRARRVTTHVRVLMRCC